MTNADANEPNKVRSLRDLPPAVEPPRDLWAGIEARIAAESRPAARRRRPDTLRWLAAAAVVCALAVGIWIGRASLSTATHPAGGGGLSARVSSSAESHDASAAADAARAVQAAYIADPKFRNQRAALVKSLEARLAALPPDSRAKVIASLATLHKSMQDLEAALGKDPTNALLQELLLNTYQDEMRVLTTVNEASEAGKGI